MNLGIDYGRKRVGIALGETVAISRGFFENDENLISKIRNIISEDEVQTVVVGLPIKDSGEEGELAPEIKKFTNLLTKDLKVSVIFEDENDSSSAANQTLRDANIDIKSSKTEVDGMAAAIILQQYLDSRVNLH